MTITDIAFHNENPIYEHDLKAYRSDSKHALASRSKFRRNRIKGHLHQIFNRMTLINSSTSILALVGAGLLASHGVYA